MDAKLYVIPGSHPSRTAMLMLELKGIEYKRVDLMPVISRGVLRALRLPRDHRPGAEDRRPQGPGLARDRPRARPDPRPSRRCSPPTPSARAAVEEAEAWGDEACSRSPGGSSGTRCGATARRSRPTPRAPGSASRSASR